MQEVNEKQTKKASRQAEGESAVLAKIAEWPEPYRGIGQRLHALVMGNAPGLQPNLWYGMPAYRKEGKVICFFRAPWANEPHNYMTFGLTENAHLTREEGASHQLLPSAWYFTALDDATEARLSEIVRTAVS